MFRRYSKWIGSLALLAFVVCDVAPAHATVQYVTANTLLAYANSENGSGTTYQANVVQGVNNTFTGCTNNMLYVDPLDHTLFATALTGVINGKSIYLKYDDSPGTTVVTSGGTLNCKLVAVWW